MTTDPEEAMQSLMGRQLVSWGHDDNMYHFVLDDGRILVFMALGIVFDRDDVVH